MAQSSGGTPDLGSEILPNDFNFNFFPQLNKNSKYEQVNYNKSPLGIPSQAPFNKAQRDLLAFNDLQHSGDTILKKIPFEDNNSRMLLDDYNGRNLSILNSIEKKSARDYPDIQTAARRVLGVLT